MVTRDHYPPPGPAKVFVPFTRLGLATEAYLADQTVEPGGMDVTLVDVFGHHWAHTEHFEARWAQGERFVNLEHDVVPWPGAIGALWRCPEPWCFHGYLPEVDHVANGCAPFGLVKFSGAFIRSLPDVWTAMRAHYEQDYTGVWAHCDTFMFDYAARQRGVVPHQHYPAVFNANPKILDAQRG